MDSKSYANGQRDGLVVRALPNNDPGVLANDDPEWLAELLDYADTRDRMYALAVEGNTVARIQAEYLDGFLSVWD